MRVPSLEEGTVNPEAEGSVSGPDLITQEAELSSTRIDSPLAEGLASHIEEVDDREIEGEVELRGDSQLGIQSQKKGNSNNAHKVQIPNTCSAIIEEPGINNSPEPISTNEIDTVLTDDTSHAPPASGLGRLLFNHLHNWRRLPKSSFACNIISKGVRLPFTDKAKPLRSLKRSAPIRFYPAHKRKILESECERLVRLGVIQEIPSKSRYYANHVFFKLKPNGTIRLIFDMKCLNTLIKKPTFSMLKSKTIFPYLHANNWAGKLDLKDAYWHIPLHPSSQKFLTFKLGKRKYKWTVVPFGLKTAPYIFSKIMYTVIKYIRSQYNIQIFNYLDDILILAEYFQECKSHIQIVLNVLKDLGWRISMNKSVTTPVQSIEFLGVFYNLESKTMKPMQKNIDKCINIANSVSNSIKSDLKLYQKLMGSLNFCSSFTFSGRYHLKFLHRFHYYFKQGYKTIPPSFKLYLKVWTQTSMYREINIPNSHIDMELYTDASNLGWGGALIGQNNILSINNVWQHHESTLHINVKELLACFYSIQHFANKIRNKSILIHIDSQVTNCWIKKQGSIKNSLAHVTIKDLLDITHNFNIQIQTKWIKGLENTLADSLSRSFDNIHPETTLNNEFFNVICSDMNFFPDVDLFSNGLNSKCEKFCSSAPNDNAISNNALNISWRNSSHFYAFPPGYLLHKVAFKIHNECNNNMLFCFISQETEPWIPLIRAVAKQLKKYPIHVEDCQIVPMEYTSHLAQHPLNLIAVKI